MSSNHDLQRIRNALEVLPYLDQRIIWQQAGGNEERLRDLIGKRTATEEETLAVDTALCEICNEEQILGGEKSVKFDCGHLFHFSCTSRYLSERMRFDMMYLLDCPTCSANRSTLIQAGKLYLSETDRIKAMLSNLLSEYVGEETSTIETWMTVWERYFHVVEENVLKTASRMSFTCTCSESSEIDRVNGRMLCCRQCNAEYCSDCSNRRSQLVEYHAPILCERYIPMEHAVTEIKAALRLVGGRVEAQMAREEAEEVFRLRPQGHEWAQTRHYNIVEAWLSRIPPAEALGETQSPSVAVDLPSLSDLLKRLGRTKEVEDLTLIGRGGAPIAATPAPTASLERIEACTKPCAKCGVNIEKNGGCIHMTCCRCRHEFCWRCLQPWSSSHHCPGAPRPEQHPPELQARVAAVIERYDPSSEYPTASVGPTRLEVCARQIVQYAARYLGPSSFVEPDKGERVSIRRTVAELEGLWNQRGNMFQALSALLEARSQDAGPAWDRRAEAVARGVPAEHEGRDSVRARRVQQEARRVVRDMLVAELQAHDADARTLEARDDELLAAIRDLERADVAMALEQRWRQLAPPLTPAGSVPESTAEVMHWWRHAVVGKALAEDSRRLLFLGRRRLCRALGVRATTEDGGNDPLGNLFVSDLAVAEVADFFSALCGQEGDLDERVKNAMEQLRLPALGSIAQVLPTLISLQTKLRRQRQDLEGVVEAAVAAGEVYTRENSAVSSMWTEEEMET